MTTQPAVNSSKGPLQPSRKLRFVRANGIRTHRIHWLWRNRIPLGEITNLNGLPGEGKSLMALAIAASVTTGRPFPDGTPNLLPPSEVLILATEDQAESVLIPRLIAAGADLSKVHILVSMMNGGKEHSIALDTDVEQIKAALKENPNIRLFIIDPVTNHLGKKNMYKEQEVREVLNQLALDNVATVIVCHLNKNANLGAQQRSMGAAGFTGRARAAFLFSRDKEDKQIHHMLSTKANYSAESGFKFRIETKSLTLDDGVTEQVPHIVYAGVSNVDADSLLDFNTNRPSKTKAAQDFLREFLFNGPKPGTECYRQAADMNISERTLNTAKKNLGVTSKKAPGVQDGPWLWALPDSGLFGGTGGA